MSFLLTQGTEEAVLTFMCDLGMENHWPDLHVEI